MDRRTPPAPGTIRPWDFPPVQRARLASGLEVRTVRAGSASLVTAMVVLRAGESAVPGTRAGLAMLAANALEGGTRRLTSRALAARLERIGASFGAATDWDSTTVALSCLAEHFGEALPLLAEMVASPSFEAAEFERYRASRMATAVQRRMDPAALAADHHARFVYGAGCAYGRPLGGDGDTVGALAASDAHDFVAVRYGADRAAVVVVGDLDPDEVAAAVEAGFGGWGVAGTGEGGVVEVPRPASGRSVHVVHRPGAVQSEIRVGHIGVARTVEDHIPLTVANLVLGGSFSSRLNLNLRERHGFTYGVRSSFAARRSAGPFHVSTSVENRVTAGAVREIIGEIEAFAADGPTQEEVAAARSYLAGVFPLRLETTGQIASRIGGLFVFDLPRDYYRTWRDRVREVTPEAAAAAARRHIRPESLCTVVVGDAEAVRAELEGVGAGDVQLHEPDPAGP